MARLQAFERELRVATRDLDPDQISKMLAATAKEALANAIRSDEASPNYRRYVNGQADLGEEQVRAPGPIVYEFSYQSEIALFALDWAAKNSPVWSGDYRHSWYVLVDGAPVDPAAIPPGATMLITNDRPYARKIDVGHMRLSVPPGIIERMRQVVLGRYGNIVSVNGKAVRLAGGYVLRGRFRKGFRAHARKGLKKDTQAGTPMTYPALEIAPR
jgi:hypothetical protein